MLLMLLPPHYTKKMPLLQDEPKLCVVIIENLSEIIAGSLMAGTPMNLVQTPISPGLIKDLWSKPLRSDSQ